MIGRILIVEDEPLLALDLAKQLVAAGFEIVGPARTVAKALELLLQSRCDAAVLDLDLIHEHSEPVAIRLQGMNIPFIFITGDSKLFDTAGLHNARRLSKPADPQCVIAELRQLIQKDADF